MQLIGVCSKPVPKERSGDCKKTDCSGLVARRFFTGNDILKKKGHSGAKLIAQSTERNVLEWALAKSSCDVW